MGNICSRSANEPESFAGPGRVVGAQPSQQPSGQPRAPLPAKTNWKNTPGRTLGEPAQPGAQGPSDEARSNAAIAAQVKHLHPIHSSGECFELIYAETSRISLGEQGQIGVEASGTEGEDANADSH